MPKGKFFDSKSNIAISVIPKEKFATGKVMRGKKTRRFDSRFKTVDPGASGGLRLTIGKTKKEVSKEAPGGAETKTQRYLVEQKDFTIKNKKLVPKTDRGIRELKQIKNRHGNLLYLGEEQFITERNKPLFEEHSYFSNPKGGMYQANKPAPKTLKKLKKLNIPNIIKQKMINGMELTEVESEILHTQGVEYVRSSKRKSFIRKYIGGTENRMRNLRLANIKRGIKEV